MKSKHVVLIDYLTTDRLYMVCLRRRNRKTKNGDLVKLFKQRSLQNKLMRVQCVSAHAGFLFIFNGHHRLPHRSALHVHLATPFYATLASPASATSPVVAYGRARLSTGFQCASVFSPQRTRARSQSPGSCLKTMHIPPWRRLAGKGGRRGSSELDRPIIHGNSG